VANKYVNLVYRQLLSFDFLAKKSQFLKIPKILKQENKKFRKNRVEFDFYLKFNLAARNVQVPLMSWLLI
jgi:hypothetical protein